MSKVNGFIIDIEQANGDTVGSGPLTEVLSFESTARLDRIGSYVFEIPATIEKAAMVQKERIIRAKALVGDTWTEVGAGPINQIVRSKGDDGRVRLTVRGDDLLREATYRSVQNLKLAASNSYVSHATALGMIDDYMPAGWTVTPDPSPPNNEIYASFSGESALTAFSMVAEKSGSHFYRGTGRSIVFSSDFAASGVRAIQGQGRLAAETCAITSLVEKIESYDFFNRIYPKGSGNGRAELTLKPTTRTALNLPAGYTFSAEANYIENTVSITAYGVRERIVPFKEISPIDNTKADLRAAANALFDAALFELRWYSEGVLEATYEVALAGCSTLLRPMQTIHVTFRDLDEGLDINETLNILETTWRMDAGEIQTTGLVVSTGERWPRNDIATLADAVTEGKVYAAHPQRTGNSYWDSSVLVIGEDQLDHAGEFPFIFGPEVSQIQQVVLRYRVDEVVAFTSASAGKANVPINIDVAVTGEIDISHDHDVPNHVHTFTIIGNGPGALTYNIGYGAGGTAGGLRHNINNTDHVVSTNSSSGATTSDSGGSVDLALSGTASGTSEVDLSDAIINNYGIYRAAPSRTYALSDLELFVNGAPAGGLETGVSTGDGYYEIDITEYVQDPNDFYPLQENNLVEIRRKDSAGELAIASSQGNGATVGIGTGVVPHNLAIGDIVTISGTTYHDGTYTVVEVPNEYIIRVNLSGDYNTESPSSGTLSWNKTAMVYCKLGVRNIIQSISYE